MGWTVWNDVRDDWAEPLAEALGRTAAEIREDGLRARDFPGGQSVELVFPDGSTASFRSAFCLADGARRLAAVFTEHCGYHVFPLGDLEVRVIRSQHFFIE